jgi:hypothetical protein
VKSLFLAAAADNSYGHTTLRSGEGGAVSLRRNNYRSTALWKKGRLTQVRRAKFFIWYSFAACCRQVRLCRWFQWIVFSQISQAKAYVIRLAELAQPEFDSRKAAAPLQVERSPRAR